MRLILKSIFTAALIAAPACSNAAPRSIDECEKIQAADAYNQCLAVFGPVAHSHGVARDNGDSSNQDEGVAAASADTADTKAAAVHDEDSGHGHVRHHGSMRHRWAGHHGAGHYGESHRWARHGGAAHGYAHRGHGHHSTAAAQAHGKRTTVAFNTVSSRGHLR